MNFVVGERLIFKKPHPCGGVEWEITKAGVNLQLRCTTCQRIIALSKAEVQKRLKR